MNWISIKRNKSTGGKFLSSDSSLLVSCGVRNCITWGMKVFLLRLDYQ